MTSIISTIRTFIININWLLTVASGQDIDGKKAGSKG
jgi:hypothetical protein